MTAKPTYEELERRVQDLEKSESERNQGIGIVQEGQYRWLVENANEMILVAQDGLIRFVNQKAFDYLGYSPEELKDRPFIQYIHPEDREKVSERHLRRLKGEDLPGVYPFRVVDRDGKARWMEISAVLSEWNGKPATLNCINDITERKRAEESLLQSHAMLARTEQIANVGSWEWDIEPDRVHWSNELFRIFQRDPKHGAPSFAEHPNIYVTEDINRLRDAVEACISKGVPYELELLAIRTDGMIRQCVARGQADYDGTGRIFRLVGSLQDITERKQAEEENRRFRTIADNSLYGKAIADLQGNLQYVNRFFANIHGYNPEQLIGKHLALFHSHEQLEEVDRLIASMMREGHFAPSTVWHCHQDGTEFPMLMSGVLIKDDKGNPQCIAASAIDMTAHHQAVKLLQESENLLESTGRMARVGGWQLDVETMAVTWTKETYNIHELPLDSKSLLGEAIEFFHPDDRERLSQAIQRALDRGEPYDMELQFITAKGNKLWTRSICQPEVVDGKTVRLQGTFQDITERKQAEIALMESEQFLQTLLESIPLPVFFKDVEGRYKGFNKAFETFFGRPKSELIGCSVFDINPPELARIHHAKDTELFEKISTQIYDSQVKNACGELRDVVFHKATLTNTSGAVTGLAGAIIDVTELKRMEAHLKTLNLRHEAMLDAVPEIIMEVDNNKIYTWANAAGLEFFGKDVFGKEAAFFFEGEQDTYSEVQSVFNGHDDIIYVESWQRRKDGEKRLLAWWCRVLKDERGQVTGALSSARDITERKRMEETLRKSEERFLLAMKASNDGLFDWNLETNDIYYSPAWKNILGYEDHELPNDFSIWEKNTDPEDVKKSWKLQQKLISKQIDRFVLEFKMKHKDGHWVDILSRAEAIFNDKGKAVRITGTHADITERKRAEEELRRYEWIIEKEMPWADTKDSGFESAYGDVTEYNKKRLILDGVKKENLEQMAADVMALLDTSLAVYESNGDYAYGIFKSSWCQNLDSAAFKLSGTNDVKKALACGKWLCHDNCWNDSAKAAIDSGNPTDIECVGGIRLYAVPVFAKNEIIGVVNIGYGNPPKDNETLIKLSKKFNISFDLLCAKANAYKARPGFIVELGKKRCQHMARMIGEIIESRQAELEKEKLQAQLTQAQKMESVGRLAGGVAHDFNNMLGVILGHTELALEWAEENSDIYSDLKEIQTAAQRSADLTKQLLTFARKQIIEPKMLNLNQTIKQMITMLQRLIGEDIDLLWKPCEALWPVKMDPSQIDQILANLCVNARDAITDVGKITIETAMVSFDEAYCNEHVGFIPGDFVLLGVSDNGSGMDKKTLSNLFEPFFTTKEMGKGTGLGLATVYGIVKQNKGFINVYSEPGQGSTFKIYLPRHTAVDQTAPAIHTEQQYPGGNETILLVEDEPAILNMVRMMLERKGYSVLSAATPAEAIALAKIHADKIHLLMTDVVMPGMNGRDLARHLITIYPDVKLLFMSGYTANVIAHQGVLDEGVSFIQKPFSRADLLVKLRSILDKATGKT